MKKKELKKRIEDGFSELSPDLFEAVWEESRKQEVVWAKAELEEPSAGGKVNTGRFPGYALLFCASLAILCLCIFGVLGQKEKSVYMVLDINPSIQIEMNEAHQVKRLKGLNQDGKDVVKELKWKKRESVQELLDVLIQDVVEKSYLCENGGILVTLAAPDKMICENLERTLGDGIDRKLTELKVSGVTTAFQEVESRSERQGRKLLEAELTKSCGMDEKLVQQMSVIELIQYCQDYTSLELKLSAASEKERAAQQKNGNAAQTSEDSSLQKEKEQTSGDDATKASDKDKAKPEETKDSSVKNGKQDAQGDKNHQKGNTDNQKSGSQEGLNDTKQPGDSSPSNISVPIQPGDGKPIAPASDVGEPPGGGSAGSVDPSVPPGDNAPGESGKPVTPGNGSSEPESPAVLPEGDDSGGLKTSEEPDEDQLEEDPSVENQPDEDELGNPEETRLYEDSESVDPEEEAPMQPDPAEQCEMRQ